jgi:TonB family protein
MVEFVSIKIYRENLLLMKGNRYCIQFDPDDGEFVNVRTGDKVEIEIQLKPDQLSREALVPVIQRILLTSRDRLVDLAPSYWANCLSRKVNRSDKHSPWECEATDQLTVPDFTGKKVIWDLPPPDNSLHNGTRHYLLRHRVAYLSEPGLQAPTLLGGPDPFFDWLQERTKVGEMTLVLAFTVGEDGRAHDVFIVTPIGMGVDDEAARAVSRWQFKPAVCRDSPRAARARVFFDIRQTGEVTPF